MELKTPSSEELLQRDKTPREYQKPLFEKSNGMNFTAEIWKKFAGDRFCMQ